MEENEKNEKWKCPICQDPLKSPVVSPCGHIFCWPCISEYMKSSKICPMCDKELNVDEFIPIYGQTNEVDSDDMPPPPKPQRCDPPKQNENRNGGANWQFTRIDTPFGFGAVITGNVPANLFIQILPVFLLLVMFIGLSFF